ncbi:hypothetical protein HNR46_000008 [Haloferula luteola]|uniref:Uncharacterized protein n=1 Tax=Haloferula luteola TaxID=595692 RepID=A0A840UUB4_9BACT|nr:hypothetical protein [Haloferula luteola]MBB5349787.1 hypothetical protein [Haloferula luteola]
MKLHFGFLIFTASALSGSGIAFLLHPMASRLGTWGPGIAAVLVSSAVSTFLACQLDRLRIKAIRAFAGPILLFAAFAFGIRDGGKLLGISVLWAGLLFAVLDSLALMRVEGPISDRLQEDFS